MWRAGRSRPAGRAEPAGLRQQLHRERKARRYAESMARQLRRDALHDPLTGLANRTLLLERMGAALARAERLSTYVGVLLLDLDRFKRVNDSLGHACGDELLRTVAARLLGLTRRSDVVSRLGGDEFVVVVEDVADGEELKVLAERIAACLAEPLTIHGHALIVRTSIGMRLAQSSETADGALRDADAAMYEAKRLGAGHRLLIDGATRALGWTPLEAEEELRQALAAGHVRSAFQPVVDLRTDTVVGVECLARWTHPRRGPIPPSDFLALAEETGLSAELDRHMLAAATRQMSQWGAVTGRKWFVGVNLSPAALDDDTLLASVAAALSESGLPASALAVEFCERSLLAEGTWTARNLAGLQALGIRLVIDDFGTANAHFSFLRRFPIDAMKVDLSYAGDIVSRSRDRALLAGLVAMAAALDMTTVAEGIDNAEQADVLRELGVGLGQG